MNYSVQILWGSESDQQRQEIRTLVRLALTGLGTLPCWRESQDGRRQSTSLVVNGRTVYRSGRDAGITAPQLQDRIFNYRKYRKGWAAAGQSLKTFATPVLIALFPKCPVCWATYMSIFGFAGIAQVPYLSWLIYVLIAIACVNLAYAWRSTRADGAWSAFALQAAAYVTIVINWKFFGERWLSLCCIGCLVAAVAIKNLKRKNYSFKKLSFS